MASDAAHLGQDPDEAAYLERVERRDEDDEQPDCSSCRGSGLSPYSIRDVPCPYCCGGR